MENDLIEILHDGCSAVGYIVNDPKKLDANKFVGKFAKNLQNIDDIFIAKDYFVLILQCLHIFEAGKKEAIKNPKIWQELDFHPKITCPKQCELLGDILTAYISNYINDGDNDIVCTIPLLNDKFFAIHDICDKNKCDCEYYYLKKNSSGIYEIKLKDNDKLLLKLTLDEECTVEVFDNQSDFLFDIIEDEIYIFNKSDIQHMPSDDEIDYEKAFAKMEWITFHKLSNDVLLKLNFNKKIAQADLELLYVIGYAIILSYGDKYRQLFGK